MVLYLRRKLQELGDEAQIFTYLHTALDARDRRAKLSGN